VVQVTPVVLKPPEGLPSEASLGAEGEWATLFADQLAFVRKSAENWRTGLVAILGLVSIFSVVEGPNAADALAEWAVLAAGAAVLASALLAVVGAVAALRAAFGLPQVIARSAFLAMGGQQGFNLRAAADSRASLNRAKVCTYLSLASLGIAVALTWFAPVTAENLVKVTTNDGVVTCGTLITSSGGKLQIDSKTAGSQQVPLSSVKTLEQPDSCDG